MGKKSKKIIKTIFIIGIIIVLIGIIYSESGETNVEFSVASEQPSCQYNVEGDVSYWVWWDSEPNPDGTIFREEVGFPIIPPKVSCYREGGWPSDGCCYDDIQCVADSADSLFGQCNGFAPYVCSDYNKYSDPEHYCKAFNINTAIRSVEKFTGIPGICSGSYFVLIPDGTISEKTGCKEYISNCRCYWDDIEDGECKSTSSNYIFCDDGLYGEGNCTQSTIEKIDECTEKGLITYIWEAIWDTDLTDPDEEEATRPDYCKDGIKTFSCNMIKLSFFTFMNIILFVLIVMIIYYCKIRKSKNN